MSLKYLNLSGLEDLWINIKNYILSKVPTKTSELTNDSGYLTSHQSLSNYVTLNTAQEITSAKTFKNTTVRKLTSVEAGNVIPSSNKLISDIWQDKNGKELGRIYYTKTSGGNTALIMRAGDWFTSNEGVYTLDASGTNRRAELHLYTDSSGNCCIKPVGYFSATLKPLSSSVWLGESTNPFGRVYANAFEFCNVGLLPDTDVQTTEDHIIGFFGQNNTPLSYITFQKRPNLKDRVAVRIQTASSAYKSYCFDASCLYPEVDNSLDIGSSSKIFKNIYCNNYYKGTTAFGDIVTHNASEFLTSHQSLSSYVTLDGTQTIAGTKTFSSTISGSISGNAGTATQFSANTTVALTGDATGTSAGSKKGWSVPVTLANSGVIAGSYGPSADVTGNNNATILVPEITVDAKGRVTSVTNRTLTCKNNTYNVYNKTLTIQKNGTNVATFTSNSNTNVTANITVPTKTSELTNDSNFLTTSSPLNASKLTGTIDIARLPQGALERVITVADQTARFALTTSSVQLGDTVKQLDTGVMYVVVNESKLNSNDGYLEYTAGSASSVPWSGITSKPTEFTPSSHTHTKSDITDFPTNVSAFTNDSGYLTSHQSLANYVTTNTNQSISGVKSHSKHISILGDYIGNESSINGRTCLYLKANRDTDGKSGLYVTKFRQNVAQGSMGSSDVVFLSHDILENETRTNSGFVESYSNWEDDVPKGMSVYSTIATRNLGTSAKPWTNAYITNLNLNGNCLINGLAPSALGMPDLSNGIDISSYIDVSQSSTNYYTPPANGWISISINTPVRGSIQIECGGGFRSSVFSCTDPASSNNYIASIIVPCIKNDTATIYFKSSQGGTIKYAKFFPCQGNV